MFLVNSMPIIPPFLNTNTHTHPKIITVSFPFPQFDNDLVSDESLKFVKEWDKIPGKSLDSIPGLDLVDEVSPNRPVQNIKS